MVFRDAAKEPLRIVGEVDPFVAKVAANLKDAVEAANDQPHSRQPYGKPYGDPIAVEKVFHFSSATF